MKNINILVEERQELFRILNETNDLQKENQLEQEIDHNKKLILEEIKEHFHDTHIHDAIVYWNLETDYILEILTHLGWCPNVVNDDEGEWAIDLSGYSSVRNKEEEKPDTVFESVTWTNVVGFKPKIREALEYLLFTPEEEDERK